MFQLLDRYRPRDGQPDLRGFEWYYWERQCHAELGKVDIPELISATTIPRWAAKGAFDRHGKFLAAGMQSAEAGIDELRIWDAETGTMQLLIPGLRFAAFHPLALSPDGNYLAFQVSRSLLDADAAVKVWDTRGRKEILAIPRGEQLAISPDGKRLAVSILGENKDKLG